MKYDMIEASEHYLHFKGTAIDAIYFVDEIRSQYDKGGVDMSTTFNDFIFNIEVALQNAGYLDDDFNLTDKANQSLNPRP